MQVCTQILDEFCPSVSAHVSYNSKAQFQLHLWLAVGLIDLSDPPALSLVAHYHVNGTRLLYRKTTRQNNKQLVSVIKWEIIEMQVYQTYCTINIEFLIYCDFY